MNADELDALEALARKATPGPWQAFSTGVRGGDHWYITDDVEAIAYATKNDGDPGDKCQENAEYIAAADPSVVLALIRRLRTAENTVKNYDTNFPCDGGCNVNDGLEETCSRHGRSPSDLWNLLDQDRKDLRRAQECIDAIREADKETDDFDSFGRSVAYILATHDEGNPE